MSAVVGRWVRGVCMAVVTALAMGVSEAEAAQSGTQLFALAEAATSIAWSRVTKVAAHRDGRLQVYTLEPERVLAGDLGKGEPVLLVQELLFETSKPYFVVGAEVLVFGKPLPRYDLYKEVLPEGRHLQWAERLDTANDLATLQDPALIEPVVTYLRVRDDPEALARHIGALVASPNERLRAGALGAVAARSELPPLLDATALEAVPAFLEDARVPLTSRGDTLVRLAHARAAGIGPIAEEVAARNDALLPAAVDALVTIDRLPSEARLLTFAKSDTEALRLVAARGLVKTGSPTALDRVATMTAEDPSYNVRRGAIQALGWSEGPDVVRILAKLLAGEDTKLALAAAEALGHEGSEAAVATLEEAFLEGQYDVQVAAAFALKQGGGRRGHEFLLKQRRMSQDHDVQRICKMVLGEDLHEH